MRDCVWSRSIFRTLPIIRTSRRPCCDPARNTNKQPSCGFQHGNPQITQMIFILLLIALSLVDARVMFEHNPSSVANREFKFRNIASPSKDDAATNAKLTLIDGDLDQGSGSLATLVDGRVPADEDEPGGNVFFRAGSTGGRFRMDFTTPIEI